jgi:hypothetical protein
LECGEKGFDVFEDIVACLDISGVLEEGEILLLRFGVPGIDLEHYFLLLVVS